MIIAIPLKKQHDNTELKFALRSIEKFIDDPEVLIIGNDLPDWITNVTQIGLPDNVTKQCSIKNKIMAAFSFAEEIFFTNDDIFLLKPTDPSTYPFYFKGNLRPSGESGTKTLVDNLKAMQLPFKHFDIHFPILYKKKEFIEAVEKFPHETIIKSMYCNYLKIEGTEVPDCKIMKEQTAAMIKQWIAEKPCFSTGVHSIKNSVKVLGELFPHPSKFEI